MSSVAGPTLGVTATALVIGAAVFMPLAAVRDHTVEQSQKHRVQTETRNTFWHVVSDPSLATSSHLTPDLVDFAGVVRSKVHSADPARALSTFSTTDHRYDQVDDELGVTALYYPCDTGRHSTCGDASPEVFDDSFSLDALQATPRNVRYLEEPLPGVKSTGLLSWRLAFKAWAATVALVFVLALIGSIAASLAETREAHRRRLVQEDNERRKLAAMGPREREVYLLIQQISKWPNTPERAAALKKANAALKTIRSGELSAQQSVQVAEAYRELDELVTLSHTWQDAYKNVDRG